MQEIARILKIAIPNSDFLALQKSEFQKRNPTGIFGIVNGIGIPPPMGVPEIGTKNWNSQPRRGQIKYLDGGFVSLIVSKRLTLPQWTGLVFYCLQRKH